MTGRIEAIYVAANAHEDQRSLDAVELVAGAGIVGDRYYDERPHESGRDVTLVEAEEIERFNAQHGGTAALHATRRNIVTRGVRLNDLVGREFYIGGVRARGVELCEPCRALGRNLATSELGVADTVRAFVHRAGLRADLLTSGPIRVGDPVGETSPAAD